jgi:hypothetical protein
MGLIERFLDVLIGAAQFDGGKKVADMVAEVY